MLRLPTCAVPSHRGLWRHLQASDPQGVRAVSIPPSGNSGLGRTAWTMWIGPGVACFRSPALHLRWARVRQKSGPVAEPDPRLHMSLEESLAAEAHSSRVDSREARDRTVPRRHQLRLNYPRGVQGGFSQRCCCRHWTVSVFVLKSWSKWAYGAPLG